MGLLDFITGGANDYVGQNFPTDLPSAADSGGASDPLAALKELFIKATTPLDLPQLNPPAGQSGPMAFSGDAPANVPFPQPRPDGAPAAPPSIDDTTLRAAIGTVPSAPPNLAPPQSSAPLNLAPPQQPATPTRNDSFGLLSLIAPDFARNNAPAINKALASIGGGLSTVTGNSGGAAFARGMGGSLKAGTSYDKDTADRALKEMKAAQEAQAAGDNAKYKAAMTNYYNILSQTKQTEAGKAPTRRQTQWDDPRFRFDRFRSAAAASDEAIDNEFVNDPRTKRFAPQADRDSVAREIAKRKQEARAELRRRYEIGPDGAPAGKAQNPGEISFKGNGTETTPYRPMSKDDFDQIEPGSFVILPTGEYGIKKG